MKHHYQIQYFGLLGDFLGQTEEHVRLNGGTPASVYDQLPVASAPVSRAFIRVAVNDEMVPWDHPLKEGDRIAFLPPMSGG